MSGRVLFVHAAIAADLLAQARAVEWAADGRCPKCGGVQPLMADRGRRSWLDHTPDCAFAAAIEAMEKALADGD